MKGSRRFHAWVGAVMAVRAAFATLLARAPRWEGTLGKLRLSPVAQALHAQAAARRRRLALQEPDPAEEPTASVAT